MTDLPSPEPVKHTTEPTLAALRQARQAADPSKRTFVDIAINDQTGKHFHTVRQVISNLPQHGDAVKDRADFRELLAYKRRITMEELAMRAEAAGVVLDPRSVTLTWWQEA